MNAQWLEPPRGGIPVALLREQGILYEALPTEPSAYQPSLDALKRDRGYVAQDEVALAPDTPNLEAICAKFVDEHRHDDDEVRFVLSGEGVFDIRSLDDRWMRVMVQPGDLLVVPKERYHRFFLTDRKAIRCVRLFRDTSGWVPHYR
jgi:1,2-dihydroxy-3-keto-5-methylthiopentene dioxygenase